MVRKPKGHKGRLDTGKMSRPQRANTFDQFIEEVQISLGKKKKKSPGRPTVAPNILLCRRDDIAQMLEIDWHLLGWKLKCLRRGGREQRSPEDVRIALEPLGGKHSAERITLLLRPTSTPATSDEVRETFVLLGRARKRLQRIRTTHQEQVSNFKDVWRAYYETSGKYRQELKIEITRRIGNVVQLRKQCAEKEQLNRNLEKQGAPQSDLLNAKAQLNKSQGKELRVEEGIIRGLKDRLAMANSENRSAVRDLARARLRQLRETKTDVQHLETEVKRLEELYEDQAAGFCRQDFLTFSIQHRGRHHPRQLANAIAGLPEMGCRQSYATCRKIPFQRDFQPNFKVFEFIARVWKQRHAAADFADLVKNELNRVPKTWLFNGERVHNHFRDYLLNNQLNVVKAIQSCQQLRPRPHPGEVPYLATTIVLESASRQQTSTLARVLSQSTSGKH